LSSTYGSSPQEGSLGVGLSICQAKLAYATQCYQPFEWEVVPSKSAPSYQGNIPLTNTLLGVFIQCWTFESNAVDALGTRRGLIYSIEPQHAYIKAFKPKSLEISSKLSKMKTFPDQRYACLVKLSTKPPQNHTSHALIELVPWWVGLTVWGLTHIHVRSPCRTNYSQRFICTT